MLTFMASISLESSPPLLVFWIRLVFSPLLAAIRYSILSLPKGPGSSKGVTSILNTALSMPSLLRLDSIREAKAMAPSFLFAVRISPFFNNSFFFSSTFFSREERTSLLSEMNSSFSLYSAIRARAASTDPPKRLLILWITERR